MDSKKFTKENKFETTENSMTTNTMSSSKGSKPAKNSNLPGNLAAVSLSKNLKKSTETDSKKMKNLYTSYSKLSELKLVTIGLASPTKIKQWAEKRLPNGKVFGQVTNANTLHHKTFKPQKGGLFCERIFGPLKDFECACGKVNKPTEEQKKQFLHFRNLDRKFCPTCDVEYTWSVIRRYQLGYISLVSPVTHIWYLKATPSYLSILLDFKKRHLESIIYCSETLTLENSMKANYTFAMANSPLTLINSWKKIMNSFGEGKLVQLQTQNFERNQLRVERFELSKVSSLNVLPNTKVDEIREPFRKVVNHDILIPKRFSNWRNKSKATYKSEEKLILTNEQKLHMVKTNGSMSAQTLNKNLNPLRVERIETQHGVINLSVSVDDVQPKDSTSLIFEKNEKTAMKNIPFYITKRSQKISSNLAFFLSLNKLAHFIYKISYKKASQKSKKALIKTFIQLQQQGFYKKYAETSKFKSEGAEISSSSKKWIKFQKHFSLNKVNFASSEMKPLVTKKTKKSLKPFIFEKEDFFSSNSMISIYKIQKSLEFQSRVETKAENSFMTEQNKLQHQSKSQFEKKYLSLIKTYCLKILLDSFSDKNANLEPNFSTLVTNPANLTINNQTTIKVQKLLSLMSKQMKPFVKVMNKIFFKNLITVKFRQLIESLVNFKTNDFSNQVFTTIQNSEVKKEENQIFLLNFKKDKTLDASVLSLQSKPNPLGFSKKTVSWPILINKKQISGELSSIQNKTHVTNLEFKTENVNENEIQSKKDQLLKQKSVLPLSSTHKQIIVLPLNSSENQNDETLYSSQKKDNPTQSKNVTISLLLPNSKFERQQFAVAEKASTKTNAYSTQTNASKGALFNNIYSLSHRYRWEIEKDWHSFLFYISAPEDFTDFPISTYQHRITPINSIPISGASIIQKLLLEFQFTELRKMDKQNRILLYDFQKMLNQYRSLAKKGYLDRFDKKDFRELLKKRDSLMRRTKLIRKLFRKNSRADWMILSVLPVLPPELRPIIKIQDQVAASDLNRLYQRILYRNERLKKFLKDPSTSYSYEMKYAQRLLQEAVDNLIENGKSGTTPERDSRGRNLKSLSEILKGKQGRFRQHLLGKRVDYSGRSVIVVSPTLKIHECGLPKEMALELFLPFLIKRILHLKFAKTVIGAKTFMRTNKETTLEILREILQGHPILLNRAPTLHRLGIQAFQPKLIDGRAILLHPLVCSAFNADFDGDQMAVHVPITAEARSEAWKLMFARNHLLSPATGEPMILPSQDMVLGCYYLTSENLKLFKYKILKQIHNFNRNTAVEAKKTDMLSIQVNREPNLPEYFSNPNQILQLYHQGKISVQLPVWLRWMGEFENESGNHQALEIRLDSFGNRLEIFPKYFRQTTAKGSLMNQFVRTTAGRMLLYTLIESLQKNDL